MNLQVAGCGSQRLGRCTCSLTKARKMNGISTSPRVLGILYKTLIARKLSKPVDGRYRPKYIHFFTLLINTIIQPHIYSCMWIRKTNYMSLLHSLILFYQLLNMFRATMCPSSGADDCVMLQPRVGIVPWLQEGCQDRLSGSASMDGFVSQLL